MSIDKENKQNSGEKRQMRQGGLFSTRERKVIPGPRYPTSGNVTMATTGTRYRFPNPYGATKVQFMGVAVRQNQNGNVLTISPPLTRIPVAGKVYYLVSDPSYTMVITGSSSISSIQAIATNPDDPIIPTGEWHEDASTASMFGNSNFIVSSVSTPTFNIRVAVDGVGHLRPAYYFAPQSSSSVGVAQDVQKYVQCGRYFLIVDENASSSTPEYAAASNETHLVNIVWNSTIVARATIVNYGPDFFEVDVTLYTNWLISGNFICT